MVGVLWAAAVLLGSAGWGKVIRPAAGARAVQAARLPAGRLLAAPIVIRLVGLVEIAVAATVVVVGGSTSAALLAVSYLLLTIVAVRMMRTAPATGCGCFGSSTEPVGRWHLVVNVVAVVVSSCAVIWPQSGIVSQVDTDGWAVLFVLLMAIVLARLGQLLMTSLPALSALRKKVAAP